MKQVLSKLNNSGKKGFGLIDIIIASAIISFIIFSLVQVEILSIRLSQIASDRTNAGFLIQESIEAVHFMRDGSWNGYIEPFSQGTENFLAWDGLNYVFVNETPNLINDKFFRTIVFEEVTRDAQDDIQDSGIVDPLTKKVIVNVSWLYRGATTTEQAEFYLTDLFNN
jgi:hypothetical protein